jgi:hypothetical protein
MVTYTTGITFLLITSYTFGCGEFYGRGPRVHRLPIKRSAITESLRSIGLDLRASDCATVSLGACSCATRDVTYVLPQRMLATELNILVHIVEKHFHILKGKFCLSGNSSTRGIKNRRRKQRKWRRGGERHEEIEYRLFSHVISVRVVLLFRNQPHYINWHLQGSIVILLLATRNWNL